MRTHARAWMLIALAAAAPPAAATTVTRVVSFTGATGFTPSAPLIQASDGNFYGTTSTGGDDGNGCVQSCGGTVFKLTPGGQLTVLHTFAYGSVAAPWANGRTPLGGLVEGPDGWLYGTTNTGGFQLSSYGIVYKISKTGTFQKLHDFCPTSPCPDGANPEGSLALGRDGNLYGTTTAPLVNPRIFRISPSGTYAVIAALGSTSLSIPHNGLVLASDGNFYGLTTNGIFRVTPAGAVTTLYLFGQTPGDGVSGNGPLIQATDGNLYGVTFQGGSGGAGTVFRISLAGAYQKIHDLTAANEGVFANGLVQGSDGRLWGTTRNSSGAGAGGDVYAITTAGAFSESVVMTVATGKASLAPLVLASDGKLYGTASQSGPDSGGTAFVVDAGLGAPVPGEAGSPDAAPMTVTAFDKVTEAITLAYGPSCYAPDHHIVYGPLSSVAAYGYSGQACNVGAFGTATFNPGVGSFFWVLAGNTAALEGSYGRSWNGTQRPEAVGLTGCDYPQSVAVSCP